MENEKKYMQKYIKGTAQVEQLGDKVREVMLRPQSTFLAVVKDMQSVGVTEEDATDMVRRREMISFGNP